MEIEDIKKSSDMMRYDPGEKEEDYCGICGDKMDVERDCYGSTSWASAMAKIKRKFDKFLCPNGNEQWHKQAKEIMDLICDTPSKFIAKHLLIELEVILGDRKTTKDNWRLF